MNSLHYNSLVYKTIKQFGTYAVERIFDKTKEGLYWRSVENCEELGIRIPNVFPIEQVKLYSDNSHLIAISELHNEFGEKYLETPFISDDTWT